MVESITGKLIGLVSAAIATGVTTYFICQQIFSIPILALIISIAATICIILIGFILVWRVFDDTRHTHVIHKHEEERIAGQMPNPGQIVESLPGRRPTPRQLPSSNKD